MFKTIIPQKTQKGFLYDCKCWICSMVIIHMLKSSIPFHLLRLDLVITFIYLIQFIYLFPPWWNRACKHTDLQMYLHSIHYIWKPEGFDRRKYKKEAIWQFIVRYIPRTCNKYTDKHISLWKARRNEFNVEQMLHYYDNTCALMTETMCMSLLQTGTGRKVVFLQ